MKSNCLRIGSNYRSFCSPVLINKIPLQWIKSARYLGIFIKTGLKFSCDWHEAKCNFFKALNSILGILGQNPSIDVCLSLVNSVCVPLLTYGISAIPLSNSELASFSNAYNCIFFKLFKTYDKNTIKQCQFFVVFGHFQFFIVI